MVRAAAVWLLIALMIGMRLSPPHYSTGPPSQLPTDVLVETIGASLVVWWLAILVVSLIVTLISRSHGLRWTTYAAATGAALRAMLGFFPHYRLIEWLVKARISITGSGVFDSAGDQVLIREAPADFEFVGFWQLDPWAQILVWSWPAPFAAAGAAIGCLVARRVRVRERRRFRERGANQEATLGRRVDRWAHDEPSR